MSTQRSFDLVAPHYTEVLDQGLSVTGGDRATYAKLRVEELRRAVTRHAGTAIRRILDFGCGDGSTSSLLGNAFNAEVVGVDSSHQCLRVAQKNVGGGQITFVHEEDLQHVQPFDLVYCNGVFHHVPQAHRESAITRIKKSLAADGLFGLFENTPWNPGTRLVMRRLPFDHDAIVISPGRIRTMMARCGLQVIATRYLFSLPPFLGPLFCLDKYLRWLPTGGQYLVLAKNP